MMDEPRRRRGRRPRRISRAGSTNASLISCACTCACLTTTIICRRVDGFVPMPMPMARPPLAATQQPSNAFPLSNASRSNLALFSSRESTAAERTTYYDILGVSMYSDTAEIKKQYKRLARMTHPDALIASSSSANAAANNNGSGTDSLPDFYEISTAYKVLSDPKKRKKYDRELAADQFVEGTAELAESVGATLGGFVVPFISNTAKATVKAAAKTATVVKNTSDQVQENIRKAREEEAERRRQQKLEEERLRAEVNERMRRKEEERLRLEAERVEQKRVEAERRAEEEKIAAAKRAEEQRLETERIAEEQRLEAERKATEAAAQIAAAKRAEEQRLETERIAEEQRLEAERKATEAAAQKAKAEQKETKELSELEKKFLQLKAEEVLEEKKPAQRSETISLTSVASVEQDSDYSLDKAIQVSIDEHSGGRRSKITKPSSRRKKNPISGKKSEDVNAQEEPYDLETALRMSKEPRSGFGTKKTTAATNSRRSKKSKRKKGQNKKRKR